MMERDERSYITTLLQSTKFFTGCVNCDPVPVLDLKFFSLSLKLQGFTSILSSVSNQNPRDGSLLIALFRQTLGGYVNF